MNFSRADLILIMTLCGSRRTQMRDAGVLDGDDMLAQSNRAYDRDLRVLVEKTDEQVRIIDGPPPIEAEDMAAWPFFTVLVMETNRVGTTYVSSFQCPDVETAKEQALLECALNWDRGDDVDDLFVLGVVKGNVEILEWDDDE